MIRKRGLEVSIEVDGGVNVETIADISSAGADIFVAGSAVFNTPDYRKAIAALRSRIQNH